MKAAKLREGFTLMTKGRQGFTLIELLIVVSVIGALATMGIMGYSGQANKARDTERKSDLNQYRTALESYASKTGGIYPVRAGAGTNAINLCGTSNPLGNIPCQNDPVTGRNYIYTSDSSGLNYVLWAQLERIDAYFVVCSNGNVNEILGASWSAPQNGVCPL